MPHQKVTFHECKLEKYMTKCHPDKIATKQSFRQYNLSIDLVPQRNVVCPLYKNVLTSNLHNLSLLSRFSALTEALCCQLRWAR